MDNLTPLETKQDNFELKRFLNLILGNWYWVLGFLLASLAVSLFIIRYESPVYVVNASFLTKKFDDRLSANPLMSLAEGSGSPMYRTGMTDVSQEIPLLKSQGRIQATLDRLDFSVSYFIQGQFKTTEVYPADYYELRQDPTSANYPYGRQIYVNAINNEQYQLQTDDPQWQPAFEGVELSFGQSYDIDGWKFKVDLRSKNGRSVDNQHYFVIKTDNELLNTYRDRLQLSWLDKGSSILNARMATELPEKEHAFLGTYIDVIVQKGLEEKSEQVTNTINFINEYLPQISDSLLAYQKRLDRFKLENGEVISGSSVVFDKLNELESQKAELMISNRYFDYLIEYIKENRNEEIFAPAMIGLDQAPLNTLLNQYIEIKWQENDADLNEFNEKNPLINRKHDPIEKIEQNIFESIKNLKAVNYREIAEIEKKIGFFYSTIVDLQVQSREYAELERMIALYETVFNNLITRRTDAFLSQASTVSDYQVVTNPRYDKTQPISPDKNKLIIIALLVGLGVPLGILYVFSIFNDKVVSKNDLLSNTNIPLLGYVGHSLELDNLVVFNKPKSLVAESFRRIRANLQYFSRGNGKNVLLITSSISAEGKTFCSVNLAFTYALSGKKTIIIGADMRKPTLAKSFGLERDQGLSNYLSGQCTLEEAVHPTGNEDLKIIPGGTIPPNPAELILMPKMKDMMDHLKIHYDYIIIDTPPIGLVADAIELMEFSDLNILIVRQNNTFKKSLHETTENYQKGQLKNLAILFNDVDFQKLEYGYKAYVEGYQSYGYGYSSGYFDEDAKQKGWFGSLFGAKKKRS